jgi:2-polyprenyl-6-methoxyphenol hydroxylase-like FAD-dependent oxidoreductase
MEAAMGAGRYDVIVVGARVAGAATAMLLARQGLRVLAVDRVSFPSDTISSHQLQVPGAALLQRWGLLGRLAAAGTPPARRVRFDVGGLVMHGQFLAYEGVDALYSPRRGCSIRSWSRRRARPGRRSARTSG